MKKSGLQDMKKRNRQVVMEAILKSGGLSRIEIANETELSPSTVSGLVNELLEEGVLKESGVKVTTAGRSRKELTVNEDFGNIIVMEIGRKGIYLTHFDMALEIKRTILLSEDYITGNELLSVIVDGIFRCFDGKEGVGRNLTGIGLLFQEDMRASDFNVMYSTGHASASISLREALISQFRVRVMEEYSRSYTVTNALEERTDLKARNSAHIAVGSTVAASVTIKGKALPLKDTFCAEAAPLLGETEKGSERMGERQTQYLGGLIALLCMLFPLDTVFLSGEAVQQDDFFREVRSQAKNRLSVSGLPDIQRVRVKRPESLAPLLAGGIREKALFA